LPWLGEKLLHFGECGDAARPAVGIAGLFVEIEHEKAVDAGSILTF